MVLQPLSPLLFFRHPDRPIVKPAQKKRHSDQSSSNLQPVIPVILPASDHFSIFLSSEPNQHIP